MLSEQNLSHAKYTGRRWKLIHIPTQTDLKLAYVPAHLSTASLSSSNQHLAIPKQIYINLSDLQSAQWHNRHNPQDLLAEIIAETETHYLAHLPQPFLQSYSADWDYADYLACVKTFRQILGEIPSQYTLSIALYVPKTETELILPFVKEGEAYLIWQANWSKWFDWNVYFYPQALASYGLDISHIQSSLCFDPSIYLDLQGLRVNIVGTEQSSVFKVYPRASTNMPTIATNLTATFQDSILESEGNLPLLWEVYAKTLHLSVLPKES